MRPIRAFSRLVVSGYIWLQRTPKDPVLKQINKLGDFSRWARCISKENSAQHGIKQQNKPMFSPFEGGGLDQLEQLGRVKPWQIVTT
jgi:hypothetical protein